MPSHVTQAPEPLRLVQRFVNTVDLELGTDELADAASSRSWLLENRLLVRGEHVAEEERRLLVEVREALRRLARANREGRTNASALRALNELAERTPLLIRLGPGGAELTAASRGVEGAIGRLLAIVFTAAREGTWGRLKACRNDACQWAFYDASRSRTGAWCSMAVCGNRHNLRAFRSRRSRAARSPR
jgi:predicted RNA-binding Zn ribbon-like protein